MKVAAVLSLFAAAVAAQSIDELVSQLPECARSCIRDAAADQGCKEGDYACECSHMDEVSAGAAICLVALPEADRCDAADTSKALEVAAEICAAVAAGGGDDNTSATPSASASASLTNSSASSTATDDSNDDDDSDDAENSSSEIAAPTKTDGSATETSAVPEATDSPGAANNLGSYGWAGAAAALAAMAL